MLGIEGRGRGFGGSMLKWLPPLGKLCDIWPDGAETWSPASDGGSCVGAVGCGGGFASPAATFLSYALRASASIFPHTLASAAFENCSRSRQARRAVQFQVTPG